MLEPGVPSRELKKGEEGEKKIRGRV